MKKLVIFLVLFSIVSIYAQPRVSIITSLFKGDDFIECFMREIVKQTIFDQCELIIIDANSPGNEAAVIKPYTKHYPNIIYKRLTYDPGIYGVWNMAIEMAQGEYITNANVDDGLSPQCYEKFVQVLDSNPDIDVVYADYYIVRKPCLTFEQVEKQFTRVVKTPEFLLDALRIECFPNNHPMWRKSLHKKYGSFDEQYKSAGDYEMWIRAASQGSKFKRIPEPLGYFYSNPQGMSTKRDTVSARETREILKRYAHVWDKRETTALGSIGNFVTRVYNRAYDELLGVLNYMFAC